jgi:heterodisulfide reductase subunit A
MSANNNSNPSSGVTPVRKGRGTVLVAGGGIAGVQAALDLADSGFYVHLVEDSPAIGGRMSQLDKTFPTNDCSACILSPKLVECGRHLNINLLTLSEVVSIDGEPGSFSVLVRQRPRYVDPDKCIACGACAEKCPKKVDNGFDMGLGKRKAVYLTYPQAVPLKYAIDPEQCIWLKKPGRCGACAKACPAGAINFDDTVKEHRLDVGAVVMAPGFRPFDPSGLDFTGYGRLPNVVTSMEFERLLSPSGPCMGHMERPSDGKEPERIAWLQCVGSRDINRACHGYCSSVCCMYAIKQAVIAREHSESGNLSADIFFMDMRTPGKDFEAYYNRASGEGVNFHRSRVHSILPAGDSGNLMLRYADESGEIRHEEFDLVVLSVGLEMDRKAMELADRLGVGLDSDNFIATSAFRPVETTRKGIFVCGAASEPKDIPQSVMEASAAACEAGIMLSDARWADTEEKVYPPERNVFAEPPRVGVFVCSCGINIASVVDVREVTDYAAKLPGVVFSQNNLFTCSQDTIDQMVEIIKRENLNRVVVASCTPRTHEALFQETLRDAGLNKFLFEMANIRDQDSWVHREEPEAATEKAKDLVRMAVARVMGDDPLAYNFVPVTRTALVVGGGLAGMTSALALADQGFPVTLVEKTDSLGGNARRLYRTWQGHEVQPELASIEERVREHEKIDILAGTTVESVSGSVGNFSTTLSNGDTVKHGAAIITVGAEPYNPEKGKWNFLYGSHPEVRTLLETDELLMNEPDRIKKAGQAVFVHCVGSRTEERPYCSRVCCTHAIDLALKFRELNPDMDIFMLYRDIRTYGKREHIYQEAREKGIVFVRYTLDSIPEASLDGENIRVRVHDPIIDRDILLSPDMVVLATAVKPREDAKGLSKFFKCAINSDGFLLEAHMKLRPVDFATDGVYLAGLCHYPKPVEETVAQAKAAASRAAIVLSRDAVPAESITATVDTMKCTGCAVCESICPYRAIAIDSDSGKAKVETGLCKGCGACVAGCRSDAVTLKNIGNQQIMASLEAAMEEWV